MNELYLEKATLQKPQSNECGFFVGIEENCSFYLREDGTVRDSTGYTDESQVKNSGYFKTEKKALKAIDKFNKLNKVKKCKEQ